MTHNLRDWMQRGPDAKHEPYAREFQSWVHEHIAAGEHEALFDYRNCAPHATRAHPTEEHFLPLFFALGAGGKHTYAEWVCDALEHGVLAMDACVFRT